MVGLCNSHQGRKVITWSFLPKYFRFWMSVFISYPYDDYCSSRAIIFLRSCLFSSQIISKMKLPILSHQETPRQNPGFVYSWWISLNSIRQTNLTLEPKGQESCHNKNYGFHSIGSRNPVTVGRRNVKYFSAALRKPLFLELFLLVLPRVSISVSLKGGFIS